MSCELGFEYILVFVYFPGLNVPKFNIFFDYVSLREIQRRLVFQLYINIKLGIKGLNVTWGPSSNYFPELKVAENKQC